MKTYKGVEILSDVVGSGELLQKGAFYKLVLKMWLNRGEPVIWSKPFGLLDRIEISDDRTELTADYRFDREYLFSGLFYGVQGMRIGGTRKLRIAPHLAFRDAGVEGIIPPNALLIVEVSVLAKRYDT